MGTIDCKGVPLYGSLPAEFREITNVVLSHKRHGGCYLIAPTHRPMDLRSTMLEALRSATSFRDISRRIRCGRGIVALALCGTLSLSAAVHESHAADGPALEEQRTLFIEAERALSGGNSARYKSLRPRLDSYPLSAYLDYAELSRRISRLTPAEVNAYTTRYPDALLASRLQSNWLSSLAANRRAADLITHYQPSGDIALECQYRQALLKQGKTAEAFAGLESLWLVGTSQPGSCDPVFRAWEKSGGLTHELIWGRIELAIRAGNVRMASFLGRRLHVTDRPWIELWIKVHNHPATVVTRKTFKGEHPKRTTILAHGIARLGYRDLSRALSIWDDYKTEFPFTDEERGHVQRTLALLLAQGRKPEALYVLETVDKPALTPRVQEWRARAAIQQRDWIGVLAAIDNMNEELFVDGRWRYWRARALEELGFQESATALYKDLSQTRNYHSFLAADRIDASYELQNAPLRLSAEQLQELSQVPGIARSRELYRLQRIADARREWDFVTQRLDPETLARAAKLADSWGWHSNAIFTAARSGYWDDLPMRFPMLYQTTVQDRAKQFGIEAAWIYGILRQESAFVPDARSPRGALGLMQLLPMTAKSVAPRAKASYAGPRDLLQPEKNIHLGSAYLQQVRNQLHNHPVLATAAYNAGPAKVRQWLPDHGAVPADIWIETIPYDETRDYVERVMAYTVIYDWQLTGKPLRLKQFMPPIAAANAVLTKSDENGGAGS